MGIITLIGEKQAKIGHKFVFQGGLPDCHDCKLEPVCSGNLEPGRLYEIVRILQKKHPCKIFESDVAVVEVKLSHIEALIEGKYAFEGATITFKPIEDFDVPIELEKFRNPLGTKSGDKYKIIRVIEERYRGKNRYRLCQLELVAPAS